MSTTYRVCGQGARLTRAKVESLAKQTGGFVEEKDNGARLCVAVGSLGFVHHYSTGSTSWNAFERFGANYAAAGMWVECLAAAGFSTLSEHDEGF